MINNLVSWEEMDEALVRSGFMFDNEHSTRTTRYMVNPLTGQAVIKSISSITGIFYIGTDIDICEKIGYANVSVSGKLRPWLHDKKLDRNIFLHRKAMQDELSTGEQVDHINGNIYWNVSTNLRVCTNEENNHNKLQTIRDVVGEDWYSYRVAIKPKEMGVLQTLQRHGFKMPVLKETRRPDTPINMKSPLFNTVEEAYENMRLINEELYGEFAYQMENDFSHDYGLLLLFNHYFLHTITEDEMYQINREYWGYLSPEKSAYMKERQAV